MSTHYLIDLFQPDVSFANSEINSVREAPDGQSLTGGNFIVVVPGDVSVQNPTSLTDLITKKYASTLSNHAGFASHIAYDDLLDDSGINHAAASTSGTFGHRGSISINPGGGKLTSSGATLSITPTTAIVFWEVYDYAYADPASDLSTRTFREQPATSFQCEVSFNGGSTFKPAVASGGLLNINLADRGTSFVIRFTNAGSNRLWLGSWAVLY
jgi:hypothetical protein